MQHLNLETLARLVDEAPTGEERVHLDGCTACRSELEALGAQTAALAELPLSEPPARAWPVLEARLAHEGLLRRQAATSTTRWGAPRLLRAAAYVGLFLLGGASGLAMARASGTSPAEVGPLAGGEPSVATVSDAQTPEAAVRHLQEAEAVYLAALNRYQELSGLPREADPAARLAALEGIVLTTRAALEAAPADPMINGYYLSAVGQRDAVLRQIARTTDDPWF
jgi:hypothetical protein